MHPKIYKILSCFIASTAVLFCFGNLFAGNIDKLNSPSVTGYRVSANDSLEAIITELGSKNAALVIANTQNLSSDLVIPSNVSIFIEEPGKINYGHHKLTLNGKFYCGAFASLAGDDGNLILNKNSIDHILPQWWGADSTGAHSSTKAILEAINCAMVSEEKKIYLPEGNYLILERKKNNTPVFHFDSEAYSDIHITGAGEATRLMVDSNTKGLLIFSLDGRKAAIRNLSFSNLSINGSNSVGSQAFYMRQGHLPYGLNSILLENISVRNMGKTAFYLAGNVFGRALEAQDNGIHGFVLRDGSIRLEQVKAIKNKGSGLDIAGGRNGFKTEVSIADALSSNNRYYGIKIGIRSNGIIISCSLINSQLENNGSHGFGNTFPDGVNDFSGIEVYLNNVESAGNLGAGFQLTHGHSVAETISAIANGGYGLVVGGSFDGYLISSINNKLKGIYAGGQSSFQDVTIKGNGDTGFYQIHGNSVISNATIQENKGYGVRAHYNAHIHLKNVRIQTTKTRRQPHGILATDGSSVTLSNSDLSGVTGKKLSIDATSSKRIDLEKK
jgi:hypothetical protein